VAELRAAQVGVGRVLLVHDGGLAASDLLTATLTMLDPDVTLGLVQLSPEPEPAGEEPTPLQRDLRRARKLGRELEMHAPGGPDWPAEVVRIAGENNYDLIVLPLPAERAEGAPRSWSEAIDHILRNALCRVFLASPPAIPRLPDVDPPTPAPTA
jgi:hypothetical protein